MCKVGAVVANVAAVSDVLDKLADEAFVWVMS